MADLRVVVPGRRWGRSSINPVLLSLNLAVPSSAFRLSETVTAVRGAAPLTVSLSDTLRLSANTVSVILDQASVGEVAFNASAGHATVISYTAQMRVYGDSTVVDTEDLGKPTPDGNNVILVDLTDLFAAQDAGTYTLSILATDAGGSTDSAESAPFVLPLP